MAGPLTNSKEWPIKIEGDFEDEKLFVIAARVEEGFNQITSGVVEFATHDEDLPLEDMVGQKMCIVLRDTEKNTRKFPGTCISVEYLGSDGQHSVYSAEFRSWLWFMSRTMGNKVFQEMTSLEIFDEVLGAANYSSDFLITGVSETLPKRDYTVQYRESDLDFVNRLCEEDGLYYYFEDKGGKDTLVICDNSGAHDDLKGEAEIKFRPNDGGNRVQIPHVFEWSRASKATSGKVSLMDYDFTKPRANLFVESNVNREHPHSGYGLYDYPGHYREASDGERLARIRMEAEAVRHQTVQATGNIHNAQVGRAFSLTEHARAEENAEYVISKAVHLFRQVDFDVRPRDSSLGWADDESDPYSTCFEAFPKDVQYRAPAVTPWPEISGVHTAVVVGPSGEEIYTDEHGRIKVQFHWDRVGEEDENSSCFVRCMMPWTGKGWGMIHIPRIGQEVVVQFEEGDPDRPLVVGMLYNADTMPPYSLPDNQTQSGFTTRSTKSGSTDTFHELMFEDKKDKELVRFQSERDYKQIVKNDAEITIGLEHKDKGDLKQTIYRNKTETLKTGELKQTIHTNKTVTLEKGDLTTEVKDGNEIRKIKKDKTEEVGKDYELTVKGKQTDKITQSLAIESMQEIELKVGGSSILIDHSGVTIKGPMITVKANTMFSVSGPMGEVKASGPLILKGMPILAN